MRFRRSPTLKLALHLVVACAVALSFPAYCLAATVVTGTVTPGVVLNSVNTLTTGATSSISVRLPSGSPVAYANGAGALAVNKMWTTTITLATSTPVTLDLTSLSGGVGDTAFTAIKILAIYNNDATSTKKITVGNAAATQFVPAGLSSATATWDVDGGAACIFFSTTTGGWTTTAHTLLKLDPGANSISCTVVIGGI